MPDTTFRIGTSGWHYKHWLDRFYPVGTLPSQMLEFYVHHFDTVEINNSFYALPQEKTAQNWYKAVPNHFCFAVKGSRFLTHMKKLKDPVEGIDRFFSVFHHLKEKLGPILFQLPPRWKRNAERLHSFLMALPSGHQYVFEFRDPDWHNQEIYSMLRQFGAAFCIYDRSGFVSPLEITANFTYIRFHGATTDRGNYRPDFLRNWALRLSDWRHLNEIYVYFNNDWEGYAIENALELKRLLAASSQPSKISNT